MQIPANQAALLRQGFVFSNRAQCKGCEAPIEIWIAPDKERISIDPMPLRYSPAVLHSATCKQQQLFPTGVPL